MDKTIESIKKEIKEKLNTEGLSNKIINTIMPWALTAMALIELDEYETNSSEDLADNIQDELEGAKKYYKMWSETGDVDYLTMAKQETEHGKKFIVEALKNAENDKEKAYARKMNALHDEIVAEIEKAGK